MPIHLPDSDTTDLATKFENTIKIDPAAIHWDAIGHHEQGRDPASHLLAGINIGGTTFHLEAIAVREGADGQDEGVTDACDAILDALYQVVGDDGGPFDRIKIEDREYVVFMTPSQ
jgi:hypothetical protein